MNWRDDKRTLDGHLVFLNSCIEYEEHDGVHTYHTCPFCQKKATRSGKCSNCLRAERGRVQHAAATTRQHGHLNEKKRTWHEIEKMLGIEPDVRKETE